jgi:hypothetical protein
VSHQANPDIRDGALADHAACLVKARVRLYNLFRYLSDSAPRSADLLPLVLSHTMSDNYLEKQPSRDSQVKESPDAYATHGVEGEIVGEGGLKRQLKNRHIAMIR